MNARVVHQSRLVLIACLIAFGSPGSSYALPDWVTSVAYSPDGDAVASGSFNQIVRLWDATTGELRTTLRGHTDSVWEVAYSPDGSTLASASFDETVRLWDATTGEHLNTLKGHRGDVFSVSYSPDGGTLGQWESGSDGSSLGCSDR